MNKNINTRQYWENRFLSGDWVQKSGRNQTRKFALSIVPKLNIDRDFAGTILDFGCGLGDAIPVYRKHFPKAKLLGMDISVSAVEQCREKYGALATFIRGDSRHIPQVDIIISSNVLEHISDDKIIVKEMLNKCSALYIAVPYKEFPMIEEHVNYYDEFYYSDISEYDFRIFNCVGWTPYGPRGLFYNIYLKNIIRRISGEKIHNRNKQILFTFKR
jgi:SAM-dependent methyltransferase